MGRITDFCVVILTFCALAVQGQAPERILIGGLFPLTGGLASGGVEREAAARVAVQNINSNDTILPNTELVMLTFDTGTSQAVGLSSFLAAIDSGVIVVIGAASSSVSQIIAIAGGVFDIPQLSYSSTSALLSIKEDFPLFGRLVPPDSQQGSAFAHFVTFFGWETFASAISTSDSYGVDGVEQFREQGEALGVRVSSYQQFLPGETEIDVEMNELSNSGSRVFLVFMLGNDAQTVFDVADDYDIIGDAFVWLCSDGCAQVSTFTDDEGDTIDNVRDNTRGLIGITPSGGKGILFEEFLDQWETLDPNDFAGSGDRDINLFAPHTYDSVFTFALAFDKIIKSNGALEISNTTDILTSVRTLEFVGLTGRVFFEENGDRIALYDVNNLQDDEDTFTIVGSWNAEQADDDDELGFDFDGDLQFFDGTTVVPDLDLRTPFDYWDCKRKRMFSDPTGKEIDKTTPDGDDPDFISSHYHCDQFIDCDNMSDEGFSCNPSYTAVFVSFGILTGMLMISVPFFAFLAILFGFIVRRRRIRVLSPMFLLGMCFASFVGYGSTYAWYGKPHTVACNFQPWLLGLSVNLMIAFLFAKTFRIWRIFKSPYVSKRIADWQLMILVVIIMMPVLFILFLWTLISTPTATIVRVGGEDHFVCETGGFTGPPGGLVFFFILVGYTSMILLFGVFLAFVTRNVPEQFSESKLVGYSVYNLTFLAAVGIPVYFVLRGSNPVIGWILRTLAILYGFTATLWLQFLPPLILLLVKDKCGEPPLAPIGGTRHQEMSHSATG